MIDNPDFTSRRRGSLYRLQQSLAEGGKSPKHSLQARWERRWSSASGAWFAVLLGLLSGQADWRVASMVAAVAFMIARGGDILDDFDE